MSDVDNESEAETLISSPVKRRLEDENPLKRKYNEALGQRRRSTSAVQQKRHLNRYGFTRLAEACESGDLEQVKFWRQKDPEQLEHREFAGNTPLQVASLNGYVDIVDYLLDQGCSPHCANTDKDTPLIDAVENGHVAVVRRLLLAGVDPSWQNLKGQQALDLVDDDTDDEIRTLLRAAIEECTRQGRRATEDQEESARPGPAKGLQFLARTPENLRKLAEEKDRAGVQEFLEAHVPVDNDIVAAAARTGDTFIVSILLAEMTPKQARYKAEKPLLSVVGTSHIDMVKFLTNVDSFDPLWRSKSKGLLWHEIAELQQGPHWQEEVALFRDFYDKATAFDSSPPRRAGGVRRPAASPEAATKARRRLVSKKAMLALEGETASPPHTPPDPPADPVGDVPSVLRRLFEIAASERQRYIQSHFLPVRTMRRDDTIWVLNYQVAGITAKMPLITDDSLPVTAIERDAMSATLGQRAFVDFPARPKDFKAQVAYGNETTRMWREAREQYAAMDLRWIRYERLLDLVDKSSGLSLEPKAVVTCLDDSFGSLGMD